MDIPEYYGLMFDFPLHTALEKCRYKVCLHTADLLREGLTNLEAKLDPARFLRIHRSTIVNIDRIKEWKPLFAGESVLALRDGAKLTVSRTYRNRLPEI